MLLLESIFSCPVCLSICRNVEEKDSFITVLQTAFFNPLLKHTCRGVFHTLDEGVSLLPELLYLTLILGV
jgi:hypothetical protein